MIEPFPPQAQSTRPIGGSAGDEPFVLPHRPIPSEGDMDITPMIDITFLLLIFFLVATRIGVQGQVELPKARYGTAVSAKNSAVLTIARGEGEQARIYKGEGTDPVNLIRDADPLEQQRQITDYIDAQLHAAVPKQYVLIKAEREVKHRVVARVAIAAARVSGVQLYVAVFEVQ